MPLGISLLPWESRGSPSDDSGVALSLPIWAEEQGRLGLAASRSFLSFSIEVGCCCCKGMRTLIGVCLLGTSFPRISTKRRNYNELPHVVAVGRRSALRARGTR